MDLSGVLEIAGRTDTGIVRKQNEDSVGEAADLGAIVLADGMGGYQSGEVASAIAVNTVLNYLHDKLSDIKNSENDEETGFSQESVHIREAIKQANETIYDAASRHSEYSGMGTTIVTGLFHDNRLTIAHVGDSRIYRIRNGTLERMTSDHNLLQELVDRGFYSQEEAETSLSKNLVTRALGIERSVAVDITEIDVIPNDLFILCSDGLHDMVDDDDILLTVNTFSDNLQETAEKLIALANENGGKDNISVILARSHQSFPADKPWHKKMFDLFF